MEEKDILKALSIQKQILDDYYRDMAKYAQLSEKLKVHDCFNSIPQQLSKDNKKFQYKLVQNGGNARIFESSLQWLVDSGIIQKCYRLKSIDQPLKAYREPTIFKVYLSDTGLLNAMFDDNIYKELLDNNLGIYKGAIYENIAAQMIIANKHELYYFEPSSHSEIDFIISTPDGPIPIEIKNSNNTKSKSLNNYIEKYHPSYAYKFSTNNVAILPNGSIITLFICLSFYKSILCLRMLLFHSLLHSNKKSIYNKVEVMK